MHVSLQLRLGKPQKQFVEATDNCQGITSRLFITDRKSKIQYLIDTGSDLCVLPRRFLQRYKEPSDYKLTAANGSIIETYGTMTMQLNLGLRRDFNWRFVIANVDKPIIGADFMAHYGLLVDCKNKRLVDTLTTLTANGTLTNCTHASIKAITGDTKYHSLLSQYPDLTKPSGTFRQTKHSTVHYINTTPGPPVFCRPRRLAPDRLKIAKEQIEEMIREAPHARQTHLGHQRFTWLQRRMDGDPVETTGRLT